MNKNKKSKRTVESEGTWLDAIRVQVTLRAEAPVTGLVMGESPALLNWVLFFLLYSEGE